jgi:hypothetical protein
MLLEKAIRSASSDRRQQSSITPTSSAMFSSVSFVRPRDDSDFMTVAAIGPLKESVDERGNSRSSRYD